MPATYLKLLAEGVEQAVAVFVLFGLGYGAPGVLSPLSYLLDLTLQALVGRQQQSADLSEHVVGRPQGPLLDVSETLQWCNHT